MVAFIVSIWEPPNIFFQDISCSFWTELLIESYASIAFLVRPCVCAIPCLSFLFAKKNLVYFRIYNPLGIFRRNFIHNGICMYCFPSTSVYMSVHPSAFSFVKNNARTLEFVNHLGNWEEFSMDFYTFRYRCGFRRTLMCKKLERKLTNCCSTFVCLFVCLHFRHRIVCKSLGHFEI